MLTEPKVEQRSEQSYFAIRKKVNMKDIPVVLPPLIPELISWLKDNNVPADGIPFFHYYSIDNYDELDVAVGILAQSDEMGNDDIIKGFFPAGKYATLVYIGDYKNMKEGHMGLESWIKEHGLDEKRNISEQGVEWGGRTEFYLTDPDTEPDPEKWRTGIVFLLES